MIFCNFVIDNNIFQSRAPQWSPSSFQQPVQVQPTHHTMQMSASPENFAFREQPSPNSNQIQSLVCDLIRQNNSKNPYNLPPWVDVTKPPPPLPKFIPQSQPQIHYPSMIHQVNNDQSNAGNASMQSVNFHELQNTIETKGLSQPPMLIDSRQNPNYQAGGDNLLSFKSVPKAPVSHHSDVTQQLSSPLIPELISTQKPNDNQQQISFQNPLVQDQNDSIPNMSQNTSFEKECTFNSTLNSEAKKSSNFEEVNKEKINIVEDLNEKKNNNIEDLNNSLPPLASLTNESSENAITKPQRMQCFSIQVLMNKCFLLICPENFDIDPSCCF